MALSENAKKVIEGVQGFVRDLDTLGVGVSRTATPPESEGKLELVRLAYEEYERYMRTGLEQVAAQRLADMVGKILGNETP